MSHTFLTDNPWVNVVLIVGFVGAAIGAIKKWIVDPLVTVFSRIGDLFEDVYGTPARQGVEPRAGLTQRVDVIERHIWPRDHS